jgi:hypothetical protein
MAGSVKKCVWWACVRAALRWWGAFELCGMRYFALLIWNTSWSETSEATENGSVKAKKSRGEEINTLCGASTLWTRKGY